MIAKGLGIMDFLAAISIVVFAFGFKTLAVFMAIYLIVKSLIFISSFASWIDLLSGGFIIVSAYTGFNVVLWIIFIWLLQKAVVSWFTE